MEIKNVEIKKGIKLHFLKTDIFKTNISAVFMCMPLKKDTVTMNALVPMVLKRGTKNMDSQEKINRKLDGLYGSVYDCGIDKIGDNQVLKFYIESINDKFAPNNEPILNNVINTILDIVFNPVLENGKLKEEYVNSEKENLRKIIEAKKDDKDAYSLESCINKMYGDSGYGLYKYGNIEDLDNITSESLYNHYKKMIEETKIDIFISGEFDENTIKNQILNNDKIKALNEREENYVRNNEYTEVKEKIENERVETEKMDVAQGKLVISLDVMSKMESLKYVTLVYNAVLGDGATSLLFRNVRERESLAYSTRSVYTKQKNNIFIKCGIEIENYEKAIAVVREQLDIMKNGDFKDEDIENAKRYLISGIKNIEMEQDTGIVYYMGQEISKEIVTPEQYIEKVKAVTREQIVSLANEMQINTIYFLRN